MTSAVEAQMLITDIAGPLPAGTHIKEMLNAVAQITGLAHRRLRGIWNGEARRIDSEEMDALRRAAARRRQEAVDHAEFRALSARLAFLEQRLAEIDPQFAGAPPHARGAHAPPMGRHDRALVEGAGR